MSSVPPAMAGAPPVAAPPPRVGERRARATVGEAAGRHVRPRISATDTSGVSATDTADVEALRRAGRELFRERELLRQQLAAAKRAQRSVLAAKLPRFSIHSRFAIVPIDRHDGIFVHFERKLTCTATVHRRKRGHGIPPFQGAAPKLQLQRVLKIHNPRLQEKYLSELQDIAGLCGGRVSNLGQEVDAQRVESFDGQMLNEYLLFHGAKSELIEQLQLQGLDPRLAGSNVGNLFGVGTYFAANSSKSDLYTTPNEAGERCILVSRVCLGEPFRARQGDRNMRLPPARTSGNPGRLNSVIGMTQAQGGMLQHPEFIVYKDTQSLPQYSLWYKHATDCGCTHCSYITTIVPPVANSEQSRPAKLVVAPTDTVETVHKLIMHELGVRFSSVGTALDPSVPNTTERGRLLRSLINGSCRIVLKLDAEASRLDAARASHASRRRCILAGTTVTRDGQVTYTGHQTLQSQNVPMRATLRAEFCLKPSPAHRWSDLYQMWTRPDQTALAINVIDVNSALRSQHIVASNLTVHGLKRTLQQRFCRCEGGRRCNPSITQSQQTNPNCCADVRLQRLIFSGREMENHRKLVEYPNPSTHGVRTRDTKMTVHLVLLPASVESGSNISFDAAEVAAVYANERPF